MGRWSPWTSITIRRRRPTMRRSPRSFRAPWSRSAPGTTTNGASPTECSTPHWRGPEHNDRESAGAKEMKIKKMSSLDLAGKRVLIREDLNVPVQDGVVTSDARIRAALPTIQAALNAKAHVLVMSHLGRPEEGKYAEEFSLAPVARRLTQLLGVPVALKRDWLDGVTVGAGEVVLLENVRFNKGEKKDSDDLARKMA